MNVCITVDMEHDCPPFLHTYRGVVEGTPRLLELFQQRGVHATFFTTGDVARTHPQVVERIVAAGHELGCHGDTHTRFSALDAAGAARELKDASATLRAFAEVTSFRAPNLDFPGGYVPLLREHGYRVDSSQGRHKPGSFFVEPSEDAGVVRVPASIAPSAMRLPKLVRHRFWARLRDPVVFFVHPWEFVDMTRTPIPRDCRFRTGDPALRCLDETMDYFARRGARFRTIAEVGAELRAEPSRSPAAA